jgi:mannosyltransferase
VWTPRLIGLIFVTALGAACAFSFLDATSIGFDEGISLMFAQLDWATLWQGVHHIDAVLALYYALLHLWLGAFGSSVFAARGLSATCAVVSVALTYIVARRLFDQGTAVIAGVVCATSSFLVIYAHDARPYALEICASTTAILAFLRFVERPDKRSASLFALVSVAAIYVHIFAVLLFVALIVSLPVLRPDWRRYGSALAAVVASVALLSAPLVVVQLKEGLAQIDWIAPTVSGVAGVLFIDFTGSLLQAIVALGCCCYALVAIARNGGGRVTAAVAMWTGIPIVAAFAVAEVHPMFVSRYLACAFPPFVLLVAAGISALPRSAPRYIVTAFVAALSVHTIWLHRFEPLTDFRAAAADVQTLAGPRDAVVIFDPAAAFAFEAELDRRTPRLLAPVIYPQASWSYWSPEMRQPDPMSVPLGRYEHLWLVFAVYDPPLAALLRSRFEVSYRSAGVSRFLHVRVERLDLR